MIRMNTRMTRMEFPFVDSNNIRRFGSVINMNKVVNFFQEAKAEMLKVNWPTKKQTLNYTGLVVAVSIVVAGFLGGLDSVFGYILRTYIIK